MYPEQNDTDEAGDWFELAGEGEESDIRGTDRLLLDGLRERARAAGWPCDPDETFAYLLWRLDHHELQLVVSPGDPDEPMSLFACAVVHDGERVTGDLVHDQTFDFELPTVARLEAAPATPEELVALVAEWFEAVLSWPVVRREWTAHGSLMYREWEVTRGWRGTSETLVLIHNGRRRPGGPPDKEVRVR